MVRDLNMPIDIIPGPIVREPDGLAMSSRNVYLSPEERKQAPALYRALQMAKRMIEEGEKDPNRVVEAVRKYIEKHAPLGEIQYIQVVDTYNLKPVDEIKGEVMVALAVFFGKTRLIDNVIVSTDGTTNIY